MFGADELLGEVEAGIDRANRVDLAAMADADLERLLAEVGALRAKLDALETAVVGEWDSRQLWAYHGARSPAAYVAWRRRLPVEACRRVPRLARTLRHLPAVAAALADGAIDLPHVQRIAALDNRRTHDALVADQVEIGRWARELRWGPFTRRLQDWLAANDPDGAEPDSAAGRRLHCSRTLGDAWRLDGWLDPVPGTIVAGELDRLERQLFDADWAAAKAELGCDPLAHQLARTAEQRRADALILMAERSAVEPGADRRGRPLFTVLVGHDSLRGILELTNGIQLRPGQLVGHLPHALFEYALFDAPLHVVGISRQRTFTGIVRKAVQVAHRRCYHPTCQEPIDRCQVDHVLEYAKGGRTAQTNARLACGHHNRARNKAPPAADVA